MSSEALQDNDAGRLHCSGVKLLVIEDDLKLARLLTRVLQEEGYVVDSCAKGEPGLRQAASGLYDMVSSKLKSLNVQCAHRGPHSLRHACAARLVAEELSLKEIGDHLGHRSSSATRVYAKVDLASLREVAAFDLGELP